MNNLTDVKVLQSVSDDTGTGTATTLVKAFPNDVVAGDLIVVGVTWDSAGSAVSPVLTDSQGNFYQSPQPAINDGNAAQAAAFFVTWARRSGPCTITVTYAVSSTFRGIVAAELSGLGGFGIDVSSSQAQATVTGGSTDAATSPNTTIPREDNQLVIGLFAMTSVAELGVAGTGFTFIVACSTNEGLMLEFLVQGEAKVTAAKATIPTTSGVISYCATFRRKVA